MASSVRTIRRLRACTAVLTAAAATTLISCRAYQPAPLDLQAYRAIVESRPGLDVSDLIRTGQIDAEDSSASAPFDPTDGVSLPEGEALTLFYNPQLRLARARAGVTQAHADTAGLWDDPVLGFDAAQILSPDDLFQYGLMLSVTLPVSGRLEAERDRAGAAHEAELLAIVEAEWAARADLRRKWAEWAAAVGQQALLEEAVGAMEHIVEITDRLEATGELARVEARLLRVEAARRRSDLRDAELLAR